MMDVVPAKDKSISKVKLIILYAKLISLYEVDNC